MEQESVATREPHNNRYVLYRFLPYELHLDTLNKEYPRVYTIKMTHNESGGTPFRSSRSSRFSLTSIGAREKDSLKIRSLPHALL